MENIMEKLARVMIMALFSAIFLFMASSAVYIAYLIITT